MGRTLTNAEIQALKNRAGQNYGGQPPPPPVAAPTPLPAGVEVTSSPTLAAPPPPVPVHRTRPLAVETLPDPLDPTAAGSGVINGTNATGMFETAQQRQSRELQLRAANEAIATIEGRGTSVAAEQQRRGLDQARAQQQSQAAGARGMQVAGARRLAARNIADLQQGAVGQASELRAQEVAGARSQLGEIAGQVRGQDIDTTSQALAAGDRATRNQNDYTVALGDLQLREKLGMLTDAREKAHLDYLTASLAQENALRTRGLDNEAEAIKAKREADNKAFWGNIIGSIAGAGAVIAKGG